MYQASSRRRLIILAIALLGTGLWAASQASALPIVEQISTTVAEGGAEAEVREFETAQNPLPFGDGVPLGLNRGIGTELATRVIDKVDPSSSGANPTPAQVTNWFPGGDRSSVSYVKFNLSANLPADLLDPNNAFWAGQGEVTFRLHIRNGPGNFLVSGPHPQDPMQIVNLRLRYRGLEPGQTYLDDLDPAGQAAFLAARTDRLGTNAHNATEWRYDWNEGAGNGAAVPGITFYNAPGIQPHCMKEGSCFDQTIAQGIADKLAIPLFGDGGLMDTDDPMDAGDMDSPYPATRDALNSSLVQTLGLYDDFDPAYVRDLGTVVPADFIDPSVSTSGLPLGSALDFSGSALKELVHDALLAGRDHVTLMVNVDNDGTLHQPASGRPGVTPGNLLNRNFLFVPNEADAGVSGGGVPAGFYTGNTLTGQYSPKLLFAIPEPTSAVLAGLGMLYMALFRRRA
jgi:hypothetical protein